MPNIVSQCQTKKFMGRTRKHVKNPVNFSLSSTLKVVCGSWMYATHRLMVIHPCAKYGKPMLNEKKDMRRTQNKEKPYKFDHEVNFQGRYWIMNVRDTSFHGDTPMCQIWLVCQTQNSYGPTRICTNRRTDRRTDRQSEFFFPQNLNFVHGGYKNIWMKCCPTS